MKQDTEKMTGRDLGMSVMEYLGNFRKNKDTGKSADRKTSKRYDSALYRFVSKKQTDADNIPVASQQTGNPEELKVSNLLSNMTKKATDKSSDSIFTMPISQLQDKVRDFTGNPAVLSALMFAPFALGGWGLSKWLNPVEKKEWGPEATSEFRRLAKARGLDLSRMDYDQRKELATEAVDNAQSKLNRRHLWTGLGAGLLGAALNSSLHYDGRGLESLYKYLPKKASMLGPYPELPTDVVRDAVMRDPGLDQLTKLQTMNMLRSAPEPMVSSTDIVNTAVETGASALANKPLGRIAVSAAADYALGYGLGSILGISRPDRLGAVFGIGTAVNNLMR